MRQKLINGIGYTEVLESNRDPTTKQPKHRCIARWRIGDTVQGALRHGRLTGRRARTDLQQAERELTGCHPDDGAGVTKATLELHRRKRALERATAHAAHLIVAEAGLARGSGKVTR